MRLDFARNLHNRPVVRVKWGHSPHFLVPKALVLMRRTIDKLLMMTAERGLMPETTVAGSPSRVIGDQVEIFKKQNPQVGEALELFNMLNDQYSAIVASQNNVKTYVTAHSLLPGERA